MPYSLLISLTDLPRSLSSNIYRLNSFVYRFCFKTIFPVLLYNLLYFYPYSLSHILYQIQGFEKIDVASDVNTIKIALKSEILNCAIPLVSSFIDIFSYQYGLIDTMSAKAWRRVWEIWSKKYPDEHIDSPCLLDYFVYNVLGRQFCKEKLCYFMCENGHKFANNGARNKYCPICLREKGIKSSTKLLNRNLTCINTDGEIVIKNTNFANSKITQSPLLQCPLKAICDKYGKKNLMAPKSISILGQTGWDSAYSEKGTGGGGLMS